MATRWDLIKATFKKKPVSTAQIVSDIRAGTQRVLQPVVQAGARYRVEHPQAAQRISIVADRTTRAIRAPVERRKRIVATENQITQANRNIIALGAQLQKAPIENDVFVGTEAQYKTYQNTVTAYNNNVSNINNAGAKLQILQSKTAQGRGVEAAKGLQMSKASLAVYNKAKEVAAQIRRGSPEVQKRTGIAGKPLGLIIESGARTVEFGGMLPGGVETLARRPETIVPALAVGGYASTIGFAKEFKENPLQTLSDVAVMGVLFHRAGKVVGKVTPKRSQVKAGMAQLKTSGKPYTKTTTVKSRALTTKIKNVDTKIKSLETQLKGKTLKQRNAIEARKARLVDKRTELIDRKSIEIAKITRAESKLRKAMDFDKKISRKPKPVSKADAAKAKKLRVESQKRTDKINKIDNRIESLLDSKSGKTASQKHVIDKRIQKLIDERVSLKLNAKKTSSKTTADKSDKAAKKSIESSKKRTAQIDKIDKQIESLLDSKIGKPPKQQRLIDIKIQRLIDKRKSLKLDIKQVSSKVQNKKASKRAKKAIEDSKKRTLEIDKIDKHIEALLDSKAGKTPQQKRLIDIKITKLIDKRKSIKLGVEQVSSKVTNKQADKIAKKARSEGRKRTDKISNIDKQLEVLEASKVGKTGAQTRIIDVKINKLVSQRKAIKLNIKKEGFKIKAPKLKLPSLKAEIRVLTQKISQIKLDIKNKKSSGISKRQLDRLKSELATNNARLINKRKRFLKMRSEMRTKLTEFEVKQQALEAESVGKQTLTEKSMNDMLKLFEEKPKSKPYREISKEFRAESKKTADAVKRGELTETRMKDGTVAVQKVKIEPSVKQAPKLEAAPKTKPALEMKPAQTPKLKAAEKPMLVVKGKIKPATKYRTAILSQQAILSVAQVMQQFKPAVVFKPVTKMKPKGKLRLLVAPKSKAATAFKPVTKYKTAQRVAGKVALKQVPERSLKSTVGRTPRVPKLLPVVPKIKTKKKAKKQPGKQIIIYTATDINNRVASLQSLFG